MFIGFRLEPILVERMLEHLLEDTIPKIAFSMCEELLDALNSFDDNISFTYEAELNGIKLNYLDVTTSFGQWSNNIKFVP